jgi:RNA polymerase sigma-70 factor, ECF subfamily
MDLMAHLPIAGQPLAGWGASGVGESRAASLLAEFEPWMLREQRRIFLICLRFLRDVDEADSAAQDTFLKAYQALAKGAVEPDVPERWLTRIAVNTCLDKVRSQRWKIWRKRPSPEDEAHILRNFAAVDPSSDEKCFAGEIDRRIQLAMRRLSDRQRAAFTLRHYEQYSLEEIGQALGLDVGTVKAHIFRAVSKLREELKDLYGSVR